MKRLFAIVLTVILSASLFSGLVVFGDGGDEQVSEYSETKVTEPSFGKENYYKIYDLSGNALTYTSDGIYESLVLTAPEQGNKAQEWQLASDPANPNKYRMISKLTGEAITPSSASQVGVSPVDLNDTEQEWGFSYNNGKFFIRLSGKARLTYTQDRVKLTANASAAKQFEIYQINEPGWIVDWCDEFDGELDESKWNRADGHLQGEGAVVTNVGDEEHVYTENGNLVLKTTVGEYGGYEAAAGMVDTAGKYYMTYGRVEMRAKLPKGYGTFPALWMLGTENIWPGNGEIDIMEISNDGSPDRDSYLFGTLHWNTEDGNHISDGGTLFNEGKVPLADDYHTYALEWEHDQIRMYFDGTLYFAFNIDDDVKRFAYGDEPHFLILDNWLLGDAKGKLFEDKDYESEYTFIIDSIKTYKREGTADYIPDETTEETTLYSTASDVIARSHDWDNRMPLAVSPDGSEVAIAEGIGLVYVVDAETLLQKEIINLAPMRELSAIAYSPDGKHLAVANLVGTVHIYNTSDYSAEPVKIYNGSVNCEQLIFTPDSSELIISGISRRAYHYGVSNQFDGSTVERKCMRVFSVSDGKKLYETKLGSEARGMALSDDGSLLALALLDGSCALVETDGYTVIATLECGSVQLHGADFSADGKLLALSDESGEVFIWSVQERKLLRKLHTETKASITQVLFSDDSSELLVNSSDNCARIYNVDSGEVLKLLGGFEGLVRHVAYSPDGEYIAVGSYDGRIKLYSAQGEYLRTLATSHTEHNGRVFSMSFSPDGEYIYASVYSFPKAVHRWRVDGAFDGSSAEYECDFFYIEENGEIEITGYRGNSRDIIVPSHIDGYPVTSIGENAFFQYGNYIRHFRVILPDTLKRIESKAFYNVASLRSIELPEGLEYIGADAFHGCKQLYEVVIPNSVTEIGVGAFDWCHGLGRVVIGGGIKTVPTKLFGGSRGITEVIFRDGVERIESGVFSVCEIERLIFADSVTECALDAFEGSGTVYGSIGSYAEDYAESDERYSFRELTVGDVDGDGEFTVSDALQILRQALGLSSPVAELSDADKDGEVTVSDALFVLRSAAGII